MKGEPCEEREGKRPPDVVKSLYATHTMAGDFEEAYPVLAQGGWDVIKKASIGDMMGVYVPEAHRCGPLLARDSDLWASRKYVVGQVADLPERGANHGTKRRPSERSMVKLFLPEQVGEEEDGRRYLFPSREVCPESKGVHDRCTCGHKHYTQVPVSLVRGGPWPFEAMVVEEWEHEEGRSEGEEGGQASVEGGPRKRAMNALLRVYLLRRGRRKEGSEGEDKLLLPPGVYQSLSQLDHSLLERFSTTLNA